MEHASACRFKPIQRTSLKLNVNPPVSSNDNCLSIVEIWEDGFSDGDYGVSLTNRCESIVNVTIKGCNEQCSPLPLEIGKNTIIKRSNIDHPDDENGQITFLWSDGTHQGQITLKAIYEKVTSSCPPREEDGCSTTPLTIPKPSGWLMLSLAMLLLVRRRRQQWKIHCTPSPFSSLFYWQDAHTKQHHSMKPKNVGRNLKPWNSISIDEWGVTKALKSWLMRTANVGTLTMGVTLTDSRWATNAIPLHHSMQNNGVHNSNDISKPRRISLQ